MKIFELFDNVEPVVEAISTVFGRGKNTIKRKFRCTSGPRKGRVVSDPATCNKPIDVAKRIRAKATRAKKPGIAAFKRGRTMRSSPITKILKRVNPLRKKSSARVKRSKTGIITGLKKRKR